MISSPYGFSDQWKNILLPKFVGLLREMGAEVWECFERCKDVDFTDKNWEYVIAQRDMSDVINSDALFVILNGIPPDEGCMIELGAAIALKKPYFLFRDDIRKCTEGTKYPLNLMIFTGLPCDSWEEYYYSKFEEISNPEKALAKWISTFNK